MTGRHDWYPAEHGLWQCGTCLMTTRQSTDVAEPDAPGDCPGSPYSSGRVSSCENCGTTWEDCGPRCCTYCDHPEVEGWTTSSNLLGLTYREHKGLLDSTFIVTGNLDAARRLSAWLDAVNAPARTLSSDGGCC